MTAQYDLDRALGAWFAAEAAPAPPPEPLLRVLETTRLLRPRPSLLARVGDRWIDNRQSDGTRGEIARLRPVAAVALVALLIAATVGVALLVGTLLRTPAPRIPHVYVNELVSAQDLPDPKAFPLVVPLLDGRVLVIGDGGDGGDQTATAVVYDPASGLWTRTGELVKGSRQRGLQTTTVAATSVLDDGRVLVIGHAQQLSGLSNRDMVTQVFDPETLTFSTAAPANQPRAGGTLTLLRDGRVLLIGGTPLDDPNVAIAQAELFEISGEHSVFTKTGSLVIPRSGHTAELLGDGTVLVYGGRPTYTDGQQEALPAELFDPATGTFATVQGSLSPPGHSVAVHLSSGDLIFVRNEAGTLGRRSDSLRWDPASGQLGELASPTMHVRSAVGLDNGLVLLAGWSASPKWLGLWDPSYPAVQQVGTSTAFAPSLVRLADGRVLIVGGLEDAQVHGGSMAPAVGTVQVFQ